MSTLLKVIIGILAVALAMGAIAAFVLFGPPKYEERIARPDFCRSCHVMEPQYLSYISGSHAKVDSCNDCHLPNDGFVRHWFWDAVVGVRDLVKFNLNIIPEHIEAKPRSEQWIEENCRRCHTRILGNVHADPKRRCWECHQELYHDLAGIRDPALRQPAWEDER